MGRFNTPEEGAGDITPPKEMLGKPIDKNINELEFRILNKSEELNFGNGIKINTKFDVDKGQKQAFLNINGTRLNIAFSYNEAGFKALTYTYDQFLKIIRAFLEADLNILGNNAPNFKTGKSLSGMISGFKGEHIYAESLSIIGSDSRLVNFGDFKKGLQLENKDADYIKNLEKIFVDFLNKVKSGLPPNPVYKPVKNPYRKETIQT